MTLSRRQDGDWVSPGLQRDGTGRPSTLARMPAHDPTAASVENSEDVEEVTAEPVPDGEGPRPALPAVPVAGPDDRSRGLVASRTGQVVAQAAAVAATGIVAGAATTALVRAARGRRAAGRARPSRRGRDDGTVGIVETRTYVVDVHLLGRR